MKQRSDRVASNIIDCISNNMNNVLAFHTDLQKAMITVTQVKLSKDFKIVYCYVVKSILSNLTHATIEQELNTHFSYTFRKIIEKTLRMKYSPEIKFFYDQNFDKTQKLYNILSDL
jgi:ribosome-binding factor A